jgi:hypothetical protein
MRATQTMAQDLSDKRAELEGLVRQVFSLKAEKAAVLEIRNEGIKDAEEAVQTCLREIAEIQSGKARLPLEGGAS